MTKTLLCVLLLCGAPLSAATITVTTDADSGPGSLRQGVLDAVTGDDIVFDSSLAGGTITLTTGEIDTGGKVLTVTGLTDAGGKPDLTISGNSASRIFNADADLYLSHLTLLDRTAIGGGGVRIDGGAIDCTNCVFESNSATDNGGGGTFSDCTFSGNSASDGGGAVFIIDGSTSFNRCTFDGNQSAGGGGIFINDAVALDLLNCTFSGNEATSAGGGAISASMSIGSLSIQATSCTFGWNSSPSGKAAHLTALTSTTITFTTSSSIFTDTPPHFQQRDVWDHYIRDWDRYVCVDGLQRVH